MRLRCFSVEFTKERCKIIVIRLKAITLCTIVTALSVAIGSCERGAIAVDQSEAFANWKGPPVVSNLDAFEVTVRVHDRDGLRGGAVEFRYPNGNKGEVVLEADATDEGLFHFSIPAEPEAGLGDLTYSIHLIYGDKALRTVTSSPRRAPMAYAEELDITGEAAVPLLYPLPDDAYQVRYVPCCNIYGGVTKALRSPVNPTGTDVGLPETLLSDFVVLEPDGLSASTSGMYFEFTYDAEKVKALGEAGLALYEWNGDDRWSEALSYDVDETSRKVSFHCPDGGAYVLGAKG